RSTWPGARPRSTRRRCPPASWSRSRSGPSRRTRSRTRRRPRNKLGTAGTNGLFSPGVLPPIGQRVSSRRGRQARMVSKKRSPSKRYFTVAEANAALPLVKVIVRDIAELAQELRERHERLARIRTPAHEPSSGAYDEEMDEIHAEFERGKE